MAWTKNEMNAAELIHGPDSMNTDTYRLWYVKPGEDNGKMLDVPGWMVGDKAGAALRMRAAEVIRERVRKGDTG